MGEEGLRGKLEEAGWRERKALWVDGSVGWMDQPGAGKSTARKTIWSKMTMPAGTTREQEGDPKRKCSDCLHNKEGVWGASERASEQGRKRVGALLDPAAGPRLDCPPLGYSLELMSLGM